MTIAAFRPRTSLIALAAASLAACSTADMAALESAPPAAMADAEPVSAASAETAWGFPIYDIAPDPAVEYGTLDNGMKYAIRRNATPQDQVVMRLHFDVGFMNELDGQQNAAHFLEHMAFNGSTNVPEGEMVKLLERNGLAFGADTNASTDLTETIYKLDLPRNDADLLDTGLMLLREIGSELTITPEAIDRERGVLVSEVQTRNVAQQRRAADYFEFLAPDTPYPDSFPDATWGAPTQSITAAELRAMYERYYRPDNATLVIVGDVDPAAIQTMVREKFGDWQRPATPLATTPEGAIALDRPAAIDTFVDPDIQYFVNIDRFAPYREPQSTVAEARRGLLVGLATAVVNRRLTRLARQEDAPLLGGGAVASDFFGLADQSTMIAVAKEGEWEPALAAIEQEYRRAMQYGFTEAEIAEALSNMETGLRNAAERQNTRQSASIAGGILGTLREERIYTTPATQLEIFESVKGDLTAANAYAAFRETFAGSQPLIHVSSKTEIEGGESAIRGVYEASSQVAVAAPVEEELAAFAYTDFGTPGRVVADERIEDLDFRSLRFDNNVMLNLKKTDYKDAQILFHVRVGAGELGFGREHPGETVLMNSMFSSGGLGQHSLDQLQAILAGKNVALGLTTASDHFHVSGSTKAEDVLAQMQVSAAYLTDPGYRPEAMAQWRAAVPAYVAQLDATPQAVSSSEVARIVANGDPRFGVPAEDVLLAANFDDLRSAITPLLADSPIEITVVGDIDEAAIVDAVAQTFGALPERAATPEAYPEARQVRFAQDRSPRTLYHAGAADQGMVQVFWPATDDDDFRREVVGRLAGAALRLNLLEVLREELGATYTPSAGVAMSDVYDGYGYAQAAAIVAPENQATVFATIDEIAAAMRDAPIDADLLARARNPMLESLAQSRRENTYWIGVLENAQLESDRLDRTRQYEELLRSVTPEDIQAFARSYFDPAAALRIAIVPRAGDGAL